MKKYSNKVRQKKSLPAEKDLSQESGLLKSIADNRLETATQRKLVEVVNSTQRNSRTHQLLSRLVLQKMSWKQSKNLNSDDYNDPVSDGVSEGGVWMYVLSHKKNNFFDIRVHFHAGSSKGAKTWTVRWNNEGSGNNVATQKWMRDRVNTYYEANQVKK